MFTCYSCRDSYETYYLSCISCINTLQYCCTVQYSTTCNHVDGFLTSSWNTIETTPIYAIYIYIFECDKFSFTCKLCSFYNKYMTIYLTKLKILIIFKK